MRTFLLFWLLTWVTGNPILAVAIILLLFGGSYLLYSRSEERRVGKECRL